MRGPSERPKWEAKVRGHMGGHVRGHVGPGQSERPCKMGGVRDRGSPRWEAVRVRGGRPCEANVGGHGSPRWEAVRGRIGRPCKAEVGG